MAKDRITLYGADWCTKTSFLKNHLQSEWIDFDYHNVETNEEAAEQVKKMYDGKLKFPTVEANGQHLKNPGVSELKEFIREHNLE